MGSPEVSVLLDIEGWPEDAGRFLASLARHSGDRPVEVVAVDRRPQRDRADTPGELTWAGAGRHIVAAPGVGFGAACNLALGAATGAVIVLVDTSLELTGDLLGDLVEALDDPTVAVAGPFGLTTADLCDYEERTAGDVAAVQGYCLAARRADLVAAGGVQEAFTWYRNADIDVALRLRTLEDPTRRAVAVGADHCRRHTHRAWEATPEAERGERSRHNMGIVHEVFFGRKDLTVP
jgi:GT2 family glycosyltransferase